MKVLIIGFGSIAKKHYQALKKLRPEAIIYALKSGSQSSSVGDIVDIYSWAEIPLDLSFAIVSNPTFKHKEVLEQLVKYNVPLFIEKPISNTLDGLMAIEQRIHKNGIISYVACNLRFLPVLQYLRNELLPTLPQIHEVSVYCGSYLPEWRPDKNFRDTYSANKEMGGGVHMDLFHELDYACWLFGIPEQSFSVLKSKSSLKIDAIDYASYHLIYSSFVASIVLNYYRRDAKRTIEIVTSEGTYLIDLLNNSITDSEGNRIFDRSDLKIADTYLEQMKYFLGIIEGCNPPFNAFSESLNILKICLNSEKIS